MHYSRLITNHLVTKVPIIFISKTVQDAIELVHAQAADLETINYVYITTKANVLVGVVSLRELFSAKPNLSLRAFSKTNLYTATIQARKTHIAHLATTHKLKAIPIVSSTKEFLGVVSSDTILEILNHEHTASVLRLAGVQHGATSPAVTIAAPAYQQILSRLPWLVLGLGGGIVAALVVQEFESVLAEQLMLAAFIPAVVYMADAVGSQTGMIFIRALALNPKLSIGQHIFREGIINTFLASILSVLFAGVSYFWLHSAIISLILGVSIFITVCATVIIAITLPLIFNQFNRDPAVASGPLQTVICDVGSLCIYLAVAALLL